MPLHPAVQGKKRDFGKKNAIFRENGRNFQGACKVLWIVWKITSDRVML
jgi:hypothetical protein